MTGLLIAAIILLIIIVIVSRKEYAGDPYSRSVRREWANRPEHVKKTVNRISQYPCFKQWKKNHATKEDLEAVDWLLKHNFIKIYDYTSHQVAVQTAKWLLLK